MVWAKAGKIGLVSSGVIRPTSPVSFGRSLAGRSYPRWSIVASTLARVFSATPGLLLSTRETVASETPASWAMSMSRAGFTTTPATAGGHWPASPRRVCAPPVP